MLRCVDVAEVAAVDLVVADDPDRRHREAAGRHDVRVPAPQEVQPLRRVLQLAVGVGDVAGEDHEGRVAGRQVRVHLDELAAPPVDVGGEHETRRRRQVVVDGAELPRSLVRRHAHLVRGAGREPGRLGMVHEAGRPGDRLRLGGEREAHGVVQAADREAGRLFGPAVRGFVVDPVDGQRRRRVVLPSGVNDRLGHATKAFGTGRRGRKSTPEQHAQKEAPHPPKVALLKPCVGGAPLSTPRRVLVVATPHPW